MRKKPKQRRSFLNKNEVSLVEDPKKSSGDTEETWTDVVSDGVGTQYGRLEEDDS